MAFYGHVDHVDQAFHRFFSVGSRGQAPRTEPVPFDFLAEGFVFEKSRGDKTVIELFVRAMQGSGTVLRRFFEWFHHDK